jgi:acetyl-CoA acetyltransferase
MTHGQPHERDAAITGVGKSQVGRRLGRSGLSLTIDAALAAINDAGLAPGDIDGIASWPGYTKDIPGMSPVAIWEVKEALGLELSWYAGISEGPAQLSSVVEAAMAVAAGRARHVLCFRTLTESSSQTADRRASSVAEPGERVVDRYKWLVPFKAYSAANWTAMYAQARFHEFGMTREQLAAVALNARINAADNPAAVYREPLTLDDYLAARMVSTPLCLFDCDVPIDGAAAVIVSAIDAARDLRHPPLRIEAAGTALTGRDSWDQRADLTSMAAMDAGPAMWRRTDLKPADVDLAQVYDGFSIYVPMWLEALGFCGRGEGGAFIEGGTRIARGGALPVNTDGGQLSAGRLHGFGLLHEACTQLWGRAGARQLARQPGVAVVGVGGGPLASCVLLTRQ